MFKKPVNYFYAPVNKNNYGAVQLVYEWQQLTPPENLKSDVLEFVKPIKKYVQVEKNFQQQINTQIFYTPEQIQKFGIKLDPTQEAAIYQKVDTKNLNATDIREISKNAVNEQINTVAINETNKQIQALQNQINQLKNQNKKTTGNATAENKTEGAK